MLALKGDYYLTELFYDKAVFSVTKIDCKHPCGLTNTVQAYYLSHETFPKAILKAF